MLTSQETPADSVVLLQYTTRVDWGGTELMQGKHTAVTQMQTKQDVSTSQHSWIQASRQLHCRHAQTTSRVADNTADT